MKRFNIFSVVAGAGLLIGPSMLVNARPAPEPQREEHARREYHFRTEDQARLRDHYRTNFREHDRIDVAHRPRFVVGGRLPGDFRARFHPFPEVLLRDLPAIPAGLEVGYVDGYAVVYDPVSLEIVEVLDVWPQ